MAASQVRIVLLVKMGEGNGYGMGQTWVENAFGAGKEAGHNSLR